MPSFNVYWILLDSLCGFQYYFCLLCTEWINLVSTWPQKRTRMCQVDLWKQCHSRRKSLGSIRLECFKTDETKSDSHRVRESFRKPASLRRVENLWRHLKDIPLIQSLRWGAVSGTSLLKVFKNFTFSGLAYLQRLQNSDISKSYLCWAGSVFNCEPCMRNNNVLPSEILLPVWVSQFQKRRKSPSQNTDHHLTIIRGQTKIHCNEG